MDETINITMADDWLNGIKENVINPEPIVLAESDFMVGEFLSPRKLEEISGKSDLTKVDNIEMIVDTTETTLGNFGQYLPALNQLKLNDSIIPSIRDIGTSFKCLTVLWMSRCGLNDIDGIASMQRLQELYIAFNNIEDISSISFLDALEVLDIEANKVSDLDQIDYLSLMTCLTTLTLTGNPVINKFSGKYEQTFQEYVLDKVPHLQQLDVENPFAVDEEVEIPTSHSQDDINVINEAIKEGVTMERDVKFFNYETKAQGSPDEIVSPDITLPSSFSMTPSRGFNGTRPSTASPLKQLQKQYSGRLGSPESSKRPGSSGSETGLQFDDSSSLTFGNPLCGNPMQALRHRKKTPISAIDALSYECDNLVRKPSMRPSTSLGLRRPFKVTDDVQFRMFDDAIAVDSNDLRELSDSTDTSLSNSKLEDGFSNILQHTNQSSESFSTREFNKSQPQMSPSASPPSPFSSPKPPPSPHRPKSGRDFRSGHFRRSVISSSQRTNVLSLETVPKQYNSEAMLRTQIDDRST